MKSFLLKKNTPIIKWSLLQDNTFYEGIIPEGYDLAVCPGEYIVVDVDRHGDKDGFTHISSSLKTELDSTFHYITKNNGFHYWFKYTGSKTLMNKASGLGIDLRIGEKEGNAGGYVVFYPAKKDRVDIRNCTHLVKKTSVKMNEWLEALFS